MTDLEALTEQPVPRPDAIAQRFARRIDPTWGFVLYGFLYWAFIANMVGTLPVVLGVLRFGGSAPSWLGWMLTAWYPLSQIPCWWLFRRWVRERRGASATIVRDGEITTATVTAPTITVRGVMLQPPIDFAGAPTCKVLYLEGARYCFVFDRAGNAHAVGIGRGNPVGLPGRSSNSEPLPEARIVE